MKKLILIILMFPTLMSVTSCRSKKTTTDYKQTEIENISISDNSTVAKKETVTENNQETKTEIITDKSFFEAWMSFESDKITITDNQGNKTEIINPRINKKSSQGNDVLKIDQTDSETNKVAKIEENQQNDVKTDALKVNKTDLKTTDERKTKIVWLYIIIGAVFVICFVYLINRYSKKSN